MDKKIKHISLLLLGGAACLLGVAPQSGSLNLGLSQAYATDFSNEKLICVDRLSVTSTVGFEVTDDEKASIVSTTLCHVSEGKGGKDHHTLTLAGNAVSKHMDKHSKDHLGPCAGTEAPDITAVDVACVDALPGCKVLGTGAAGIWIPQSGLNADGTLNVTTVLNDYFSQTCSSGASGMPDSERTSYRDIHGQ